MSKQDPLLEHYLNVAHNGFGSPLTEDCKERIRRVVKNPTVKNWDNAFSIVINNTGLRKSTLWQCILIVDPSFPRTGKRTDRHGKVLQDWERAPDRETLMDALRIGCL